jgi:16S rRNA (guanine(527)-N(7))-methyltransferase RsmG
MGKSAQSLEKLLQNWEIPLDSHPADRMMRFLFLLEKWNSRVNLTASSDWEAVGLLFEEAIWANKFYSGIFSRHLDIGSGAGFPAIILKILNPLVTIEMVESRAKRAAFLDTVLQELDLKNALVFNRRVEEHLRICEKGSWDCISWKGIKLNSESIRLLSPACDSHSQLWMFHGKELAVADLPAMEGLFKMLWRERFPGKEAWFLSVFHVKQPDEIMHILKT